MEVGKRVKISGTNTIWDGKEGVLEDIDEEGGRCTVFVDFKPEEGKKVRQDFSLDAISESLEESYKNKETGEVGDIEKDFHNGFVLFKSNSGKSQVALDDLEEIEDKPLDIEKLHLEQAQSFKDDLDYLDSKGRFDEFEWLFNEEGGSVGILRLKGLEEARSCGKVEIEILSNNNKFNNPNNIKVYALKKGIGSGNQFRAYFYIKGDVCTFVRGHIKTENKNGPKEYKCIQDTIDYATNK